MKSIKNDFRRLNILKCSHFPSTKIRSKILEFLETQTKGTLRNVLTKNAIKRWAHRSRFCATAAVIYVNLLFYVDSLP